MSPSSKKSKTQKKTTRATASGRAKKKSKKNSNPLYAVTNKGNVVQEVDNFFDLIVKKLHLEPFMELLEGLLQELSSMAKSYPMLVWVQEQVEWIVQSLEALAKKFRLA